MCCTVALFFFLLPFLKTLVFRSVSRHVRAVHQLPRCCAVLGRTPASSAQAGGSSDAGLPGDGRGVRAQSLHDQPTDQRQVGRVQEARPQGQGEADNISQGSVFSPRSSLLCFNDFLFPSQTARYVEASALVLAPLIASLQKTACSDLRWDDLTPQLFVTFWSLGMADLQVPNAAYAKQITQLRLQMVTIEENNDLVRTSCHGRCLCGDVSLVA